MTEKTLQDIKLSKTKTESGSPSPPPDGPAGPSSGDQGSSKLGVSSPGELDPVVGQANEDQPTSSHRGYEDVAEGLAGLNLDGKGKGETEHGPAPDESQVYSLQQPRPAVDAADAVPSSVLATDGDAAPEAVDAADTVPSSVLAPDGDATPEAVDAADTVPSSVLATDGDAVPEAETMVTLAAIVSALDVAGEEPRIVESEESEAEDEQSDNEEFHLSEDEDESRIEQVAPGDGVAEITSELAELELPRIRRAPNSYFYATTATYEGISRREVSTEAAGRCIANTPRGTRCKNYIAARHTDICSSHYLYLRGHIFRREVLHVNKFNGYQDLNFYTGEIPTTMVSRREFEDFTDDFHPRIKQNLYYLVRDFLLVLGTSPDKETILDGSPSVIAKKYCKAKKRSVKLTELTTGCKKGGQVYMLVPSPRDVDLGRMWFAGDRVQRLLPVKIGQSEDVARRFTEHQENCGIQSNPSLILPSIKYVELLERILHELFVAHQHDLLCSCGGEEDDEGTNHVEFFWFERLSGGPDLTKDFEDIVNALMSDIQKCQEFVGLLGDRLSPILGRRQTTRTIVQRRQF